MSPAAQLRFIPRRAALATLCATALGSATLTASCGGPVDTVAHPGATGAAVVSPPAAAEPDSPAEGELGLIPGESMSFEVKLAGVQVGEAALAVGELGELEGKPAITVRSKIGTTGAVRLVRPLDDESTTVIDAISGAPLRLSTHVLMNAQETFTEAVFSPGQARVEVRRGKQAARPFTFVFGDLPAHDAHSAMAHVRSWRPQPGTKRTVWLVGGRRMWRVDLSYAGQDAIGTSQGNRDAVRLDGIAYRVTPDHRVDDARPPRRFSVWMSNDADRVPLRVTAVTELGNVEISLADYQRP
jgi:Protein of unknown function (DUF3108)